MQEFLEKILSLYSKSAFQAVYFLYDEIDSHLLEKDFDFCDKALEEFSPEKLPIEISIGLLRITFLARNRLRNWNDFKFKINEFLILNNKSELLSGL